MEFYAERRGAQHDRSSGRIRAIAWFPPLIDKRWASFMVFTLLFTFLVVASGATMAQQKAQPPHDASAGRDLRARMLLSHAGDFDIRPNSEFRRVWGVIMDWPLGDETVSVVALCDGNASLYTTGTFGVIGGIGHRGVRQAAIALVRDADGFYPEAKATSDRSYPKANRVRFYLLAFDGLRVVEDERNSVEAGQNRYSALFGSAQDVITELRKVAEKRR